MSINTKKVSGRRELQYSNFDELLTDAQQLATESVTTLGNWSQGQIYDHLAQALNVSIDGGKLAPAPLRWILTAIFKKKFLTQKIPPGFPAGKTTPPEISTEAGLASLEAAIARVQAEPKRAVHPGFGKITRDEWDQFSLRHAELHMSFLVPEE